MYTSYEVTYESNKSVHKIETKIRKSNFSDFIMNDILIRSFATLSEKFHTILFKAKSRTGRSVTKEIQKM